MQMDCPSLVSRLLVASTMVALSASMALAQSPTTPTRASAQGQGATAASYAKELDVTDARIKQHPLYPVLQIANKSKKSIAENIDDYTCTIVRRERIAGKLNGHEFIDAKIRHEKSNEKGIVTPFSVYLRFTKPARVEGREALFVEGENAGKVFVRRGGERMAHLSTFIKPDSRLAMRDNRYPITEIGFANMVDRLIDVIENDLKYDECEVKFFSNAKVNDRVCTRIEVTHPKEREHFRFHQATVYVDDKDRLPIAYVSYTWPEKEGEKPRLLEEYVYTNIVLNPGLTDTDFDRDNPAYGFSQEAPADSGR